MPTTERGIFDKTTSEEDGRIGKINNTNTNV